MRGDQGVELAEVKARASLVALIGETVPIARQRGGEAWACCPFHLERTPSFKIDDGRGFYHCFGCGTSGDAVDWIKHRDGCDFKAAADTLRQWVGLGETGRRPRAFVRAPDGAAAARRDEKDRNSAARYAMELLRRGQPARGSLVEVYLRARRITITPPAALSFDPACSYAEAGVSLPAMLAAITDAEALCIGVHRTYLRLDGGGKAAVANPKKSLGRVRGGSIRLGKPARRMGLAEGIESALSATQLQGIPCWSAVARGNFANAALPPLCRELVLFADNDAKDQDQAQRIMEIAAAAHRRRGLAVEIHWPPRGTDFNDLLFEED